MNISQRMTQQQSLILSPQLQQSLALLQAPLQELDLLVSQFTEENPCAEVEVSSLSEEEITAFNDKAEPPADMQWTSAFGRQENDHTFLLDSNEPLREETLEEYLLRELSLAGKDISIVYRLDDRGYFTEDLDSLSTSQRDALRFIRTLEPKGLGALCLADCLCLQLPQDSLAYRILQDDEDSLTRRQVPFLAKKYNVTFTEIEKIYALLKTKNFNPGSLFATATTQTKDPEIFLLPDGSVHIPEERIPNIKISSYYQNLLPHLKGQDREYIREKIKSAKFFIRSILQRQSTIRSVTEAIVVYQKDYLESFDIAKLKPLTMAQIAETVGVHETTVSRAVCNKYISTSKGTFELRFFFTSGLSTAEGLSVSNASVKDQIAEIIATEDKKRPLSDEEIVAILKGTVARRTVAKYRAELNIQPSHLRRTYGK